MPSLRAARVTGSPPVWPGLGRLRLGCPSAAPGPPFRLLLPSASGFPPRQDSPRLCPPNSHTSSAGSSFPGPSCLSQSGQAHERVTLSPGQEPGDRMERDHTHNKRKVKSVQVTQRVAGRWNLSRAVTGSYRPCASPLRALAGSVGAEPGLERKAGVGMGSRPQARAQIWLLTLRPWEGPGSLSLGVPPGRWLPPAHGTGAGSTLGKA